MTRSGLAARMQRIDRVVPGPLEQLLARDDRAIGAEQELEHRKLLRAQRDRLPCSHDPAASGVELQVAVHEGRSQRRARAPRQRPDPSDQLSEVEGLGQVVVGADAEAFHPVLERSGGGQHQHAARAPVGDHGSADLISVHAREVPIEHDDVVVGEGNPAERLAAVESDVDGDPLAAQDGRHGLGEPRMILDHQHPHRSLLRQAISLLGQSRAGRAPPRPLPAQDAQNDITAT